MLDYRFAIELLISQAEYGWLATDANNIYGKYEWIDWRDKRKKPSQEELRTAWGKYVNKHGTPEEQEAEKKQKKELALQRLKANSKQDVKDLLELLG